MAPGWYLEKPHQTIFGVDRYAGPYPSFDLCEDARVKLANPQPFLCLEEIRKPS